jgi:hypothetical protein
LYNQFIAQKAMIKNILFLNLDTSIWEMEVPKIKIIISYWHEYACQWAYNNPATKQDIEELIKTENIQKELSSLWLDPFNNDFNDERYYGISYWKEIILNKKLILNNEEIDSDVYKIIEKIEKIDVDVNLQPSIRNKSYKAKTRLIYDLLINYKNYCCITVAKNTFHDSPAIVIETPKKQYTFVIGDYDYFSFLDKLRRKDIPFNFYYDYLID